MFEDLLNTVRRCAAEVQGQVAQGRYGMITSYDPTLVCAKVKLLPLTEDENQSETGFLPIQTPWVGQNCGMSAGPPIGAIAWIEFAEGDINSGTIMGYSYGQEWTPLAVESGEWIIKHSSGSLIHFTNAGTLIINGNVSIDVTTPTLNITTTSAVNIQSPATNISANGTGLMKLVTEAFETKFNEHTHVVSGPNTEPPTQQMDASDLTVNLQAT